MTSKAESMDNVGASKANVKNLRSSAGLRIIAVGEGHDPPAENRYGFRMLRKEYNRFSPVGEMLLLCKSTGRVTTLPYRFR